MQPNNGSDQPNKRGPKPDARHEVKFKVEHPVYEQLSALQPSTGMMADEIAGLLLHLLITDLANATKRIEALLGPRETVSASTVTSIGAARRRSGDAPG